VSLRDLAPGLTPRALLEKFNAMQMIKIIDVHLPTTDGRTIILSRYTQPEADLQLLLKQLKLITRSAAAQNHGIRPTGQIGLCRRLFKRLG
jgi:hypothetical protein